MSTHLGLDGAHLAACGRCTCNSKLRFAQNDKEITCTKCLAAIEEAKKATKKLKVKR